jgi:hypothetical protein
VNVRFDGKDFVLKNVLFVPSLGRNLFSVPAAVSHGVSIQFTMETCRFLWSCGYRFLLTRSGSMFILKDCMPRVVANASATKDAVMHTKDSQVEKENDHHEGCNPGSVVQSDTNPNDMSSSVLWHRRFGHLGYDNVRRLVDSDHVKGMESVSSVVKPCICEVCVKAKAKTLPFSASQSKAEAPLALLYIDLMGPSQYRTHDGFRYVLVVLR